MARKKTPTIETLLPSWPQSGQTFEQLRAQLPEYDTAKDLVFKALESGVLLQRYDETSKSMMLVKNA